MDGVMGIFCWDRR